MIWDLFARNVAGKTRYCWSVGELWIFFAQGEETGSIRDIPSLYGKATEEPMRIYAKSILRERTFPQGAKVNFSQQDLWEICLFFKSFVIPSTIDGFAGFLKSEGVQIHTTGVSPDSDTQTPPSGADHNSPVHKSCNLD